MEARIAGLLAVRTYDPTRGTSLSTWVVTKARCAVLEALRETDPLSRLERSRYRETCRECAAREEPPPPPPRVAVSYEALTREWDAEAGDRPVAQSTLLVHDTALLSLPDRLELEAAFRALVGRVSPAAWLIAQWHLLEERTLKECGERLALSESRAQQVFAEAQEVLRRMLEGKPLPPVPKRRHDSAWRTPFLAALSRGTNVSMAIRIAGVHPSYPYHYLERHPEFRALWDKAKTEGGTFRTGPAWRAAFLRAMEEGKGTIESCRIAAVHPTTPCWYAQRHPEFRALWDAARKTGGAVRVGPEWREPFLRLIASGLTDREATARLGINEGTPRTIAVYTPEFREAYACARAERARVLDARRVPCDPAHTRCPCLTEKQRAFILAVLDGHAAPDAARAAGINPGSPATIARRKPVFRQAWDAARERAGRKEAA